MHGYVEGVRRLMVSLGMIDGELPPRPPRRVLRGGAGDVDASLSCRSDGWCLTAVLAGEAVDRGELIAEVLASDGQVVEQVTAPFDGTAMMLRRRAEIRPGDSVAMLGPPASVSR